MNHRLLGILAVTLSAGCTFESDQEASAPEAVGAVEQEINLGWVNTGPPDIVGMLNCTEPICGPGTAMSYHSLGAGNQKVGLVCWNHTGGESNPCAGEIRNFSAPLNTNTIRGVGSAQPNSLMVAWYSSAGQAFWSSGTTLNLSSHGFGAFTLPFRPGSNVDRFTMDELIDGDRSASDSKFYYYWLNRNDNKVYRSVSSTQMSGGTTSTRVVATLLRPGVTIQGIGFWPSDPFAVSTYYSNGVRNLRTPSAFSLAD